MHQLMTAAAYEILVKILSSISYNRVPVFWPFFFTLWHHSELHNCRPDAVLLLRVKSLLSEVKVAQPSQLLSSFSGTRQCVCMLQW